MNNWLEQFKRSQKAWDISNRMLMENANVETISFAAQTMRRKVIEDFNDLNLAACENLRASLVEVSIENLSFFSVKNC